MIEFTGYFLVALLIGIILAIGASIAVGIIGKASFLNVILLLAVIHAVSYFLLRGDYQKNFYNVVRIGIVAILFQIMFLGGATILGTVGISRDALFTVILVIGIYEIFKTKARAKRLEKLSEKKAAPKVEAAPAASREDKEAAAKREEKRKKRKPLMEHLTKRAESLFSRSE